MDPIASPYPRHPAWPSRIARGVAAGLALLVVGVATIPAAVADPQPGPVPAMSPSFSSVEAVPPGAQQVEVGIYPTTIYSLDQKSNTFYADMYLWFTWKGDKDPTETMELVNAVEEWGLVRKNIYEQPRELPDGRLHQEVHVEGRFFYPFALSRFPFEVHNLAFLIEDSTYTADQLVYVPDRRNSGLGQLLKIPGWHVRGWRMDSLVRTYDTNFGDATSATNRFSHLSFEMTIARPISFFLWKLLLPLVIVLSLSWSALLVGQDKIEVRTAMPATGLLTAVFLQLSYSSSLPDLGEPVLMDKIYVLAYLLIVVVIAEVLLTGGWVRADAVAGQARARRADRITLVVEVLAFVVGTTILIAM